MCNTQNGSPTNRWNKSHDNVQLVNLAWFLIWRFLANAHQRQIKDRIKICLHKDDVVLTAPDAKINTGKILF